MGRTCSTYGAIEKRIQSFSGKTGSKETFREAETWMESLLHNIKMDLREVGCDPEDGIALAEDRDQCRA